MIDGDEDSKHLSGDNANTEQGEPAQEEKQLPMTDYDACQTTIVLEECGDPHPAPRPTDSGDPHSDHDAKGECEESNDEQEGDEDEDDPENDEH